MEDLIRYLDKVTADEELKEKTKAFVKNACADDLQNFQIHSGKREWGMRKLINTVASIAACLIMLVGGYAYYNTPVNYVSLDINPSVELGINAFNRVVRVEGINADGQFLLEKNKLKNMSVENALQELVQVAAEQGYVAGDGSTVIALTAFSDNVDKGILLRDRTRDRVQQLLYDNSINAVVYADCSNLQIRTQSQEEGISPGKYRLILMMQALDPDITMEQYRGAKITEIMTKANELFQSSGTATPELEQTRAMIREACQEICQNQQRLQEQNRDQSQYQNGEQGQTGVNQEQNKIKNQYQNQLQDQTGEGLQNQAQNNYQNQTQNEAQTQTQTQIQTQNQTQNSGEQPTQVQNETSGQNTQAQQQGKVKQGNN